MQPSSSLWSPQSLSPSHCHCAGIHVHSPNALTAHVKWLRPQAHSEALDKPGRHRRSSSVRQEHCGSLIPPDSALHRGLINTAIPSKAGGSPRSGSSHSDPQCPIRIFSFRSGSSHCNTQESRCPPPCAHAASPVCVPGARPLLSSAPRHSGLSVGVGSVSARCLLSLFSDLQSSPPVRLPYHYSALHTPPRRTLFCSLDRKSVV